MTGEGLREAIKVGARGIIVGGIEDKELTKLLGYEIGVAITGNEQVGLTLIITEGFGRMRMAQKTFSLLKEFTGQLACINGATQIRAGVMRPEIIIPREGRDAKPDEEHVSAGLLPSTPIRIIRAPYFGNLGHVISLPVELQKVESESTVRVLEAQLEDKRRVIVPRANVEIIEE